MSTDRLPPTPTTTARKVGQGVVEGKNMADVLLGLAVEYERIRNDTPVASLHSLEQLQSEPQASYHHLFLNEPTDVQSLQLIFVVLHRAIVHLEHPANAEKAARWAPQLGTPLATMHTIIHVLMENITIGPEYMEDNDLGIPFIPVVGDPEMVTTLYGFAHLTRSILADNNLEPVNA